MRPATDWLADISTIQRRPGQNLYQILFARTGIEGCIERAISSGGVAMEPLNFLAGPIIRSRSWATGSSQARSKRLSAFANKSRRYALCREPGATARST